MRAGWLAAATRSSSSPSTVTTWRSHEPGFASRFGTSGSAGSVRRGPPMSTG